MDNFLTLYFRYSHLTWWSWMFPFSRRFKQVDTCSFIYSTYFLFKIKELLKIHKPLPLAIICDLLRVKDMGEWSVERDASISGFFILKCGFLQKTTFFPGPPPLWACSDTETDAVITLEKPQIHTISDGSQMFDNALNTLLKSSFWIKWSHSSGLLDK